ncbi:hypothetical protein N9P41_01805 [Pseudomonadales bacterium]|nr:hypothetical protein [Pseudomonadales bacterium]MDA9256640.1 hypothetical protein [Pseudomonadales bacterium]
MKTFSSLVLGVSTLAAASAFAAPPAPAVPTGACAGMITKNSLVTHPYSDSEVQNEEYLGAPHAIMYMDFDNGLAYMDGILETGAVLTNEEDRSTVEPFTEIDGGALTVSVSDTYTYALDVNISYTLEDEAQDLPLLFVPTNGGTTFFVMETGGVYKGVCQQI